MTSYGAQTAPPTNAARRELTLRLATHPVFLREMSERMRANELTLPDGKRFANELRTLNQDDQNAFVPALLSAWAAVCDVLSFYQERIANEGYLATAIEPSSVRALARSIGYQPAPPLSAATYLTFTLLDAQGAPASLLVPKGTAVQSVPLPGETQVTFETDEDVEARPAFNALSATLRPPTVATQIVGGAKELNVSGAVTTARRGMPVLMHGRIKSSADEAIVVRELMLVDPNPVERTTVLGWDVPLEGPLDQPLMVAPEALVFGQSGRLFGATAPDWMRQPATLKAQLVSRIGDVAMAPISGKDWTKVTTGLPPGDIHGLAVGADGSVAAAVGETIVVRGSEGEWKATGALPTRGSPTALALESGLRLYVGTLRGDVFSSADGGATWFAVAGGDGAETPKGMRAHCPVAPIQCLSVVQSGTSGLRILAGTPFGLWSSAPNGSGWSSCNAGLPGYDEKSGGATAVVNDVCYDPSDGWLVIATDKGLYRAETVTGGWHAAAAASSQRPTVLSLISRLWAWICRLFGKSAPVTPSAPATPGAAPPNAPTADTSDAFAQTLAGPVHTLAILHSSASDATLFAGTEHGVCRSSDGGRSWGPTATQPGGSDVAVYRLAAAGALLIAATSKGLFQSADAGATWTVTAGPFETGPVTALAAGAGLQVAAAPFGGYPGDDWPNFAVTGRQFDLDRLYPTLIPGSWIVLAQPDPSAAQSIDFAAARVTAVSTVVRRDYLMNDRVSRVTLDRDLPKPQNPRTVTVYFDSRALASVDPAQNHVDILGLDPLASAGAVAPMAISVAGAVQDLKGRLISISGRRASARLVGCAGGVRRWEGNRWTKLAEARHDGHSLITTRDGSMLLGSNVGVQRFDGKDWINQGDLGETVYSLVETGTGDILAGTMHGIWRWCDGKWSSCGLSDQKISALLAADGVGVLAGTDQGVQKSDDAGVTWKPAYRPLSKTTILALLGLKSGATIVGTARDGLYVIRSDAWDSAAHALQGHSVNALAVDAQGHVCAGTDDGVFRSADGLAWHSGGPALAEGDFRALAFDPSNGALYAAKRGVGVLHESGDVLLAGLANDVRSLAFDREGKLLAGSLGSSVLTDETDARKTVMEPKFVANVMSDGLIQRLTAGKVSSDLRHVFGQSQITLSDKADLRVLSRGVRWRICDGAAAYLLQAVGDDGVRVFLDSELEVMGWPTTVANRPDLTQWRVRSRGGVVASLFSSTSQDASGGASAAGGDIVFTAAGAANETIAEVQEIVDATVVGDRSRTGLSLSAPLNVVYDAATVTFNANVAPASHRETPPLYEVIGSGDSSTPNQSFVLKRKPIAVRPSAVGAEWNFKIDVRVRGSIGSDPLTLSQQLIPDEVDEATVQWRRVRTFVESGPTDRHYVLAENDDGAVVVTFGDGKRGSRLPTGRENVIALYGTGSGPDGNVGQNSLTMLRKRPAGVRKVANPTRATGGTVGEVEASVRRAAPIAVRALGRIVSLRDYHDFARAWPGVTKVAVRLLSPTSAHRFIHLTLATAETAAADHNATVDPDLRRAIETSRAIEYPIRIDSYQPKWFSLDADVSCDSAVATTVLRNVRAMLLDRYGFAKRGFAQPVVAADVTAAIQDMRGVRAVRLKALHMKGSKAALNVALPASDAYWDNQAQVARPAELLLIGGDSEIVLSEIQS